MVINGSLSGFLISGMFTFKVSFLGIDLALEIWLFTKLFLYPRFVKKRSSSVDLVSKKSSFEPPELRYKTWVIHFSAYLA